MQLLSLLEDGSSRDMLCNVICLYKPPINFRAILLATFGHMMQTHLSRQHLSCEMLRSFPLKRNKASGKKVAGEFSFYTWKKNKLVFRSL